MIKQHAKLIKQIKETYLYGVSDYQIWYEICFRDGRWVGKDYNDHGQEFYSRGQAELFETYDAAITHLRDKILSDLKEGVPEAEDVAFSWSVEIPQEYKDMRKAQLLKELVSMIRRVAHEEREKAQTT